MKCKSMLCLGVFVVGMVAFGSGVKAGPRDGVTPVSTEVVKNARMRDGLRVLDIRDDLGQMEVIRVGSQGGVAAGTPSTPVFNAGFAGYIAGPWNQQDDCATAMDAFTAPTGWGEQLLFGNGAGAGDAGGANLASFDVIWCAGYNHYFDGDGVCNLVPGDDTSCPLYGPGAGACGGYDCICVDCYDGSAPYTVVAGMYTTADPCVDGTETLIPGTEVTLTSSNYRLGGVGCTLATVSLPAKAYVPDGSYFELKIGLEDAWFPLGYVPDVGTNGNHLDWWLDADSDGCYDTFSCFSGDIFSPGFLPWLAVAADAVAGYTLSLVPVGLDEALITTGIVGNTITMSEGGHKVALEFWWSDWSGGSKGDIAITAMQANLDSSGFYSGLTGTITYPDIDCTSAADCWGGGPCGFAGGSPAQWVDKCEPGYMGDTRQDYIFSTLPFCVGGSNPGAFCFGGVGCLDGGVCISASGMVAGNDLSTNDLRFGATLQTPAITSSGIPTYAATILTEISADATGTFTIWPQMDPAVGLLGANGTPWQGKNLPLLGLIPAEVIVEIGQCCDLSPGAFTCLSDTETLSQCTTAGGVWTPGKTCADDCGCLTAAQCADTDGCTVDVCEGDSTCSNTAVTLGAGDCCDSTTGDDVTGTGTITNNIDGDQCTDDLCVAGVAANPDSAQGTTCDDGICDTFDDMCDGAGACDGTYVQGIPCTADADCPALGAGCAAPSCNPATGFCRTLLPVLLLDVADGSKPEPMCFAKDEKVSVAVKFDRVGPTVNGAQFTVNYDPACLTFNSISPGDGTNPYTFEIMEQVNGSAGTIFYAVGVDPFGGVGLAATGTLATISFDKVGNTCVNCELTFGGANPQDTFLVDPSGWQVEDVEFIGDESTSDEIHENDDLALMVPTDVTSNTDCDTRMAVVTWDAAAASSTCEYVGCNPLKEKCYVPALDCFGFNPDGSPVSADMIAGGGAHSIGTTTYSCTATSSVCGDSITSAWSVTVNDMQSIDVEVQLSPTMVGDQERCIKFELFSDCTLAPQIVEADLVFGGADGFIGHLTDSIKSNSSGLFSCITARDQLHTLRSCATLACDGDVYSASFRGDPLLGGNWLVGGNLDGYKKDNMLASHDVIDVLDFGTFIAQYIAGVGVPGYATTCGTAGPNGDINGDGVVNNEDFSFIYDNFMASSKDCCCGAGSAAGLGNTDPTTSVTIGQLRQNGLGDLAVADLDGDGDIDVDDMTAFLEGARPTKKGSRGQKGSGMRR